MHDLLILSDPLLFATRAQIEQIDSVVDELGLDSLIQARVSLETGGLVDFNEPRLTVFVNHDIKAQNLKTELVLQVIRLTRLV